MHQKNDNNHKTGEKKSTSVKKSHGSRTNGRGHRENTSDDKKNARRSRETSSAAVTTTESNRIRRPHNGHGTTTHLLCARHDKKLIMKTREQKNIIIKTRIAAAVCAYTYIRVRTVFIMWKKNRVRRVEPRGERIKIVLTVRGHFGGGGRSVFTASSGIFSDRERCLVFFYFVLERYVTRAPQLFRHRFRRRDTRPTPWIVPPPPAHTR